jgi:hypothetical protein
MKEVQFYKDKNEQIFFTRRGRATPTAVPKDIEEPNQNIDLVDNVPQDDSFIDKVFNDEQVKTTFHDLIPWQFNQLFILSSF